MDTICYRNILNEYKLISEKEYVDSEEFDDEIWDCYIKESVIVNEKHKQSIIFRQYRYDEEEFLDNSCEIPNYISSEAYDHICKVLNLNDNVTVLWTQIYGTTSDYKIIFGHYFTNSNTTDSYIESFRNNKVSGYKYTKFVNEEETRCEF